MGAPDLSKADEKAATLLLKLKAKSGYRAEHSYEAISANQWSDIIAVCEDGDRYRTAKAAPSLLEALEGLVEGYPEDGEYELVQGGYSPNEARKLIAARAAIAAAKGGAA